MPAPDPHQLLRALEDLIGPHLKRSEPARRAARLLAAWLLDACHEAESSPDPIAQVQIEAKAPLAPAPGAAERDDEIAPATPPSPTAPATQRSRGIVPLRIGDATAHVPVNGTTTDIGRARRAAGALDPDAAPATIPSLPERSIDLALVEQRCALKAASCRLFIERRAAAGDPQREPVALARMDAMLAQAKSLPRCFLWVFFRDRPQPDDTAVEMIAGCYDALREGVSLVRRLDDPADPAGPERLGEAMQLLAQADSALRVAVLATWLPPPEADQDDVHRWMKQATSERGIFVARFMRLDDPADPRHWPDLLRAIRDLRERAEQGAAARREVEARFKRIRYHARRVEDAIDAPEAHDIDRIIAEAAALRAAGVPPSDPRWSGAISPAAAARLPATNPAAALLTPRRSPVERPAPAEPEPAAPRVWSAQVQRARETLAGRTLVVIGGEPRQDAIGRITDAFGTARVDWVRLQEHGTGEPMRAPIQRDETALVLVLIKLVGHLHAEQAMAYARSAGKPVVLLPAGYNPEQIADAMSRRERPGVATGA